MKVAHTFKRIKQKTLPHLLSLSKDHTPYKITFIKNHPSPHYPQPLTPPLPPVKTDELQTPVESDVARH